MWSMPERRDKFQKNNAFRDQWRKKNKGGPRREVKGKRVATGGSRQEVFPPKIKGDKPCRLKTISRATDPARKKNNQLKGDIKKGGKFCPQGATLPREREKPLNPSTEAGKRRKPVYNKPRTGPTLRQRKKPHPTKRQIIEKKACSCGNDLTTQKHWKGESALTRKRQNNRPPSGNRPERNQNENGNGGVGAEGGKQQYQADPGKRCQKAGQKKNRGPQLTEPTNERKPKKNWIRGTKSKKAQKRLWGKKLHKRAQISFRRARAPTKNRFTRAQRCQWRHNREVKKGPLSQQEKTPKEGGGQALVCRGGGAKSQTKKRFRPESPTSPARRKKKHRAGLSRTLDKGEGRAE